MNPNHLSPGDEPDRTKELIDSTDRILDMVREDKGEPVAAATTDFNATFEANVSKTNRIPTEKLLDKWNAQWEAAHREASQGHTTLPGALRKRFGDQIPIIEDGRVIGLSDPNEQQEVVKEVRKGTPSKRVHKPKTDRSTTLRRPLGPDQLRIADDDKEVQETYSKPGEVS